MELVIFNRLQSRGTKTLLLMTLLLLLTSCGASVTPRGTTAQTNTPNIETTDLASRTTTVGAECNYFDSTKTRLQGKVTTYYSNKTIQEDKVRIRLSAIAEVFSTSSTAHFKMFRWKAETGSPVELDSNPVNFTIEKGTTNSSPIGDSMTSLTLSKLTELRTAHSIAGTTVQEFFNNTVIVVSGVDYSWDALKLVLYEDTTTVGDVDFLLPVFSPNPNTYGLDHTAVLAKLHPFYSQRTKAHTDEEWLNRTKSFCF